MYWIAYLVWIFQYNYFFSIPPFADVNAHIPKKFKIKTFLTKKNHFQHPKSAKVRRKFLVVESIYLNTGEMCPLDQMIDLKRKFKLRLFIDESISFGTLGKHGKGITEHKNISVILGLRLAIHFVFPHSKARQIV